MIRAATLKDLARIDRLGHLFNLDIQKNSPLNELRVKKYAQPKPIKASYFNQYLGKDHKMFVATKEGKAVGFVSGRIFNQKGKKVKRYGKLDDLYISPDARGLGFASQLVETLMGWFKESQCEYAVLFASPQRPIHKYYQKAGFNTIYHYMCKRL